MTKEEILKRAIDKAIKNGYKGGHFAFMWIKHRNYLAIIFDPEFAKAFWGEEEREGDGWNSEYIGEAYEWEYHQHRLLDLIQEEKDPIEYLEQFL